MRKSFLFSCCLLSQAAGLAWAAEPALPPVQTRPGDQISSEATSIKVTQFLFNGNTAFTSAELGKVLADYTNRPLTSDDLENARRALTLHYVNHGYINSGAILPNQSITEGKVTFQIVEGKLNEILIKGEQRGYYHFLIKRLKRAAGDPMNLTALHDELELVREDPVIKQINAELKPGGLPGESTLEVTLVENNPWQFGLQFANNRSPSVGAESLDALLSNNNLTGNRDLIDLRYGIIKGGLDHTEAAGLDDLSATYRLPFTSYETTAQFTYERSTSLEIEAPFDSLNISSETESFSGVIRQPLYHDRNSEFAVSIGIENKTNKTKLLGQPFSLSPGARDGVSTITPLRFTQEYFTHTINHSLALRSTFSAGLDALDATRNAGDLPDGQFFTWRGQAQYIQRLFETPNLAIFRVNAQLTNDRLMSLEQFSIGGMDTVRGYRENELVRDKAVTATAEFRVPLILDSAGAEMLTLAPFADLGYGKNVNASTDTNVLSSVGVGVLVSPNKHIQGSLYWGYGLQHIHHDHQDLQDIGIHFSIKLLAL